MVTFIWKNRNVRQVFNLPVAPLADIQFLSGYLFVVKPVSRVIKTIGSFKVRRAISYSLHGAFF